MWVAIWRGAGGPRWNGGIGGHKAGNRKIADDRVARGGGSIMLHQVKNRVLEEEQRAQTFKKSCSMVLPKNSRLFSLRQGEPAASLSGVKKCRNHPDRSRDLPKIGRFLPRKKVSKTCKRRKSKTIWHTGNGEANWREGSHYTSDWGIHHAKGITENAVVYGGVHH